MLKRENRTAKKKKKILKSTAWGEILMERLNWRFYSKAEVTGRLHQLEQYSCVRKDLQDPIQMVCKYSFGIACSVLLDATAVLVCIDWTVDVSKLLKSYGDQANEFNFKGVWWWAIMFNSTYPTWLENTLLSSSFTSDIQKAKETFSNSFCPSRFHVEATPFSFWL